jgi:integrase
MHLRKLSSGHWHWIVKVHGSVRRGTELSKAKAKMAASEAEIDLGRVPRGSNATFGELLEAHLADREYAPTLHYDLRRLIDRLDDDVKAWRVRDIEAIAVEHLYRRLAAQGWKPNTLKRLHMVSGSAFKRALGYGWVTTNPFRVARAPRVERSQVTAPSVEQVRSILDSFQADTSLRMFLRISATTGARRGEVCALQWPDIDLDTGTVVIRRSVAHVTGIGLVISEGKTGAKGHRVIGIDPATVTMLSAHKQRQTALAVAARLSTPLWVFSHDAGISPWRGDYVSRSFRNARDAAGAQGVRLHDLRHHVATQMLASGDPVTVVSKRLGHASPVTTLGVYAHMVPAADRTAADRLGSALD